MATAEETIRDWLYEVDGDTVTYAALGQASAAILAVLNLHPAHNDDYHDGPDYCPVCIAEDGGTQAYPCPTVAAVAAALGCGEQP